MKKMNGLAGGCVVLGLVVVAGGCRGPEGSTGGRIDPYRTTESDRESPQASIPALLEFGDITAEALAQDLSEIEEVKGGATKAVLELGSIANQTRTPTGDFEQLRNRLRGRIFQSKLIRKYFLIVEGRPRMEAEVERVNGGVGGLFGGAASEPAGAGETARYDPKITYVLQGDFFESNRGGRRQYYFEFKLTNLATRVIVFQRSFDLGQE